MKCPQCSAPNAPKVTHCASCGFSSERLRRSLGDQWVRLERITDAAHCLRLEDYQRCEVEMDDFERLLPQAFFAVYLGMLPAGLRVAELGFWLLNQGAFNTPLVQKRNDFGIVLVLDPAVRELSLTFGYAIESYFDEVTQRRLLQRAAKQLKFQAYGAAIRGLIQDSLAVLERHAKRQLREPLYSGIIPEIMVQPLRGGVPMLQTGRRQSVGGRHSS